MSRTKTGNGESEKKKKNEATSVQEEEKKGSYFVKLAGLFISQLPNPPPSACTTEQQQWVSGLVEPVEPLFLLLSRRGETRERERRGERKRTIRM